MFVFLQDRKAESIQRTANSIAHLAHQLAFDPDYMSPFAQAANEYGIGIKGKFVVMNDS